ncbi:phosphatidylethanolamine:Kdo2-lipid A phosphoethanolamine transferase [Noviherbaspirillum humi]|uniref:Phosphatidylethanolamine:Kdo2-lipid A phosphoethanolamine transferase n=2 Tax=Noviherbaspirillum humi TaxID=1688639 RepID=A0A239KZ08_9BURK|nr:phosphatidylethanolamine:Kdo2-lipid A phosphoethanolamine transferase [Noviherbaspirillum humi]
MAPRSGKLRIRPAAKDLWHFRSPVSFSLALALLFLSLYNVRFWREAGAAFWTGHPADAFYLAALAGVLLLFLTALLLLIPGSLLPRVAAVVLIPLAAMAAFCADSFGLGLDQEMFRSFAAADSQEASSMLSVRLVAYTLLLGILPLFFVGWSRLAVLSLRQHAWHRLLFIGPAIILAAALIAAFPDRFRAFADEHARLHYLLVPNAAVKAWAGYAMADLKRLEDDRSLASATPPRRLNRPPGAKPLLVFLVIGETARHQNFQLGGYARPTNPRLSAIDHVFYFGHVESCGTSTAVSLPCMFSYRGRQRFDVNSALKERNIIDDLIDAGIDVEWRTNNSGGRSAARRAKLIDFRQSRTPGLCEGEVCYDEVLLQGLEESLATKKDDTLIVFHQIGSHGPDYFRRYPPSAEIFKPACRGELTSCSGEEIVNAYDNTIAYTDRLLADQIGLLEKVADKFDTALFYLSDHGESLGEHGVHLHGAPAAVAPPEQKRIPLLLWMSPGFMQRHGIDLKCMSSRTSMPASHDQLPYTVSGMMGLSQARPRSAPNLAAPCMTDAGQNEAPLER